MATTTQALIQQLVGTQTQAQQGASNAANNGNPNSVYNTSAWGYGGIPTQNADGSGWSVNQYSRPASVQLGGWVPPQASVSPGTGQLPPGGGIVGQIPTVPGWTPAPLPPATVDPIGGGGTPTPTPTTAAPGQTVVPPGNAENMTPEIAAGMQDYRPGPWLPGTNANGYQHNNGSSMFGKGGSISGSFGLGENITWQGILDAFLPGDLWDSASGTWNMTEAAKAALNQVVPFLGDAAEYATKNGLLGQTAQDLVYNESMKRVQARTDKNAAEVARDTAALMEDRTAQMILQRAQQRASAFMPGGQGWNPAFAADQGGQLGDSAFDSEYNGNILSRMDSWGAGGTGNATPKGVRSGQSAGSGVLAEGQAAQDMVAGWRNPIGNPSAADANALMKQLFGDSER